MYYRYRMYSAGLGRFMRRDPIGYDGGINVYAYVRNRPLNFFDPMGLLDWGVAEANAAATLKCQFVCAWKGLEYWGFSLGEITSQEEIEERKRKTWTEVHTESNWLYRSRTVEYWEKILYLYDVKRDVTCECCNIIITLADGDRICCGDSDNPSSISYEAVNWAPKGMYDSKTTWWWNISVPNPFYGGRFGWGSP